MNNSGVNENYYFIFIDLKIRKKVVWQEISENMENMFHCSEK